VISFIFLQAASVAILPFALFVERLSPGASWVFFRLSRCGRVEPLIIELRPPVHSGLSGLASPAIPRDDQGHRPIDLLLGTRNGPASVDRFNARPHPRGFAGRCSQYSTAYRKLNRSATLFGCTFLVTRLERVDLFSIVVENPDPTGDE
jgi:hypothetical protein